MPKSFTCCRFKAPNFWILARTLIINAVSYTPRYGFVSELRSHALFEGLDWDSLLDMEAPFVPNPDDEMDTTYFDGENNIISYALFESSVRPDIPPTSSIQIPMTQSG